MLSILRNFQRSNLLVNALASNALAIRQNNPVHIDQQRTYYAEYYVKKDRFKSIHKKLKSNKSIDLAKIRANLQYALGQEKPSLDKEFQDDFRTMIYLAADDRDLKLVLQCFQKYAKVREFSEMSFSMLYFRKLVSLDKTQLATDVFLNKNNDFNFMNHITSALALVDHLVDKKRYDDVIEVFEKKFLTAKVVPRLIFMAVSLSLLKKNDKEALMKAKKYINHMQKRDFNLSIGSVVHIFFLAFQQNEIEYAFKFLSETSRIHRSLYCNLLIIGLAKLDQSDAALEYAKKLATIKLVQVSQYRKVDSMDGKFFRLTLDYLQEAVERSNDNDFRTIHESIRANVGAERIIETNMIEHFENASFGIDKNDFNLAK